MITDQTFSENERSEAVSRLRDSYSQTWGPSLEDGPKIKVSAAVSTLASVYEKFRQAMEYNEPHLLRRAATERILSRRLRGDSNSRLVSEGLVNELIRGRYLKNDFYPESLLTEAGRIVEKYRRVLHQKDVSTTDDDFSFLMRLASAEIEEFLVPPAKDDALANLMIESIRESAILDDPSLTEDQKSIQLRIAVYKNLLKLDRAMLEFNIFELFYPGWKAHGESHLEEVSMGLPKLRESIQRILEYPLAGSLSALIRGYTSPFILLQDALEREGTVVLTDRTTLARAVSSVYERRLDRERDRLATTTTRALIYIFLTKAVLSFAFELPAEGLLYGGVRMLPFVINFIFPPFLLFLLTLSMPLPGRSNADRVIAAAKEAIFGDGSVFSQQNRLEVKKRGFWVSLALFAIYLLTFFLGFGTASYLLTMIGFTPFAIVLFLFYTSVVTYFGFKVRDSSKELLMAGGRETVGSVIVEFFALPFLRAGKVVSAGLARFNFLMLFVSLLVEAPIQILLEFLEEWVRFAREKREEVY